jgi:serine/threonine protein kinase
MRAVTNSAAPTLRGNNWSPDFHDFVAKCCTKDSKDRPDASALLTHPFVLASIGMGVKCKDVLKPAVDQAFELKVPTHTHRFHTN